MVPCRVADDPSDLQFYPNETMQVSPRDMFKNIHSVIFVTEKKEQQFRCLFIEEKR